MHAIASVKSTGRFAVLSARLNGHTLQMLYDPGAAFSVISKQVWLRIGSLPLSPIPDLLAYTKVPNIALGSATVTVDVSHRRKSLSVCVVENDDTPLFGLDWVLAFDMALPEGVKVCTVSPYMKPLQPERPPTMPTPKPGRASTSATTQRSPSTNKRLKQLLDEYADIFKPGHDTIRG